MKKFKVSFKGRLNTSIGITYKVTEVIEMPKNSTPAQIIEKLYEKYEHISDFRILN